ncbi:MAG TPA: IclR family transcriptional regulator C-terminal domain-containing protein, partial [Casimicrobiaceae bacterium]|nr:IclR family transcriptional regulator C-terminal domain-containing protein [Casimicrobiaceae bacterium]
LARGLAVVAAFTDRRRRPTIADLSRKTGIPRAAVRRCLYTLEKLGYVNGEGYSFSLSPKILSLGHAYLGSAPVAVSAQPFLDKVSDEVQESCSLAVLERDDILYLARSVTSRILSVTLNVGSRLPAYCTSIGQVLLADLGEDEIEAYIDRTNLVRYTDRTVASASQLRDVLEAVRRNGHAIADQEMEVDIRSIAVPVRNASGAVVAGMNVIAQATRMTIRDMKTKVLPPLQRAAAELSTLLPR